MQIISKVSAGLLISEEFGKIVSKETKLALIIRHAVKKLVTQAFQPMQTPRFVSC